MKKTLVFIFTTVTFLPAQTSYNVSLYGQMNKYGINPLSNNYSEVWGWTDTVKNREYAFIGSPLGTSVVDITDQPVKEVSFLIGPTTNNGNKYHEFRTYKNYLYIGSEGTDINRNAGIQIVDLSTLPDSASFKKAYVWIDTASSKSYYTAHTVSIEKNFLYVNGGTFGGTRILDISDPLNPLQVGSYGKGNRPYVHDVYIKNDTLYAAAINKGTIDIVDLTTKRNILDTGAIGNKDKAIIRSLPVIPEGSTHQVWLSEDSRYMFVATETSGGHLHIYDISNRTNPIQIATWTSDPTKSIHNVFVKGNFLYIAYYKDGLRVLDIANPAIPIEVAFYDTYTIVDGSTNPYKGAWGAYPYYASGKVVVSDMNTGLYVFDVNEKKGGRITGVVRDAATNQVLSGVEVLVEEMGRKYTTDVAGSFLYGSAEGKHTIKFSKNGYLARVDTVSTKPAQLDTFNVTLTSGSITSVSEFKRENEIPVSFGLAQNFPNPFNPSTVIIFSIEKPSDTSLRIFDVLGKEVAVVINQFTETGSYTINFDAKQLSSGIYFYRLSSGTNTSIKKMIVAK
ncbi:MAG: choice-of-anchor B family protein [Bacteroidota bacterium]|nr:choice-of-anchor B family protein [Bacteroidota bacterium]